MNDSNIIIVSDNPDFASNLSSKIALLRAVDNVSCVKYSDVLDILGDYIPEVILIDGDDTVEVLEFLSNIQVNNVYKNIPLILCTSDYDEDLLLNAFDNGISDFILKNAFDSEILMRVIWAMKNTQKLRKLETKDKLLNELEVLQTENDIYTQKYCSTVFENEVKTLAKYKQTASFMVISPDINCRQKLTTSLLGSIIKKSVRSTDVVGYVDNFKFYILLPNTKVKGLFAVYEKIKEALTDEYSISVGATEIRNANFQDIENSVNKALDEALSVGNSIIIADNASMIKADNWLDKINNNQRNFKLFKQAFLKKFNNVIIPVFYQMQKAYEENLFETKINQMCEEHQSIFELIGIRNRAKLRITYPGFSKINIDFEYSFDTNVERLTFTLSELNDSTLSETVKDFIEKYRNYVNNNNQFEE